MIDVILKTNGLDVRVLCTPSEDVEVNAAGKTLELITKLIDELWPYETVNISIKTREDQGELSPPVYNSDTNSYGAFTAGGTMQDTQPMEYLYKVHEDNMMRVYNEKRTIS
jgi:hypothetical protein